MVKLEFIATSVKTICGLAFLVGLLLFAAACKDSTGSEKPSTDLPEYTVLSLDSLKVLAREKVEKVKNDPQGRYQMREVFYKKYGDGKFTEFGFGNSELAFLKWETRDLLNPPDSVPAGSPWWRAVNLEFIYWSELAGLIFSSGLEGSDTTELPVPVVFWLDFLEKPSSGNWYKAHNSSIISGYGEFAHLAQKEVHAEQVFINMVLYRLLYAQAMVESEHFAFGKLGELLANPSGLAVDFIVNDHFFYPTTYPLTSEEIDIILGKVHSIGEVEVQFMDDVLILPHLEELYSTAAEINKSPGLLHFIDEGQPIYPHLN